MPLWFAPHYAVFCGSSSKFVLSYSLAHQSCLCRMCTISVSFWSKKTENFLCFVVPKLYLMRDADIFFYCKALLSPGTIWSFHRFQITSNCICAKMDHAMFRRNECFEKMPHRTICETSALGMRESNPQSVYFCKWRRQMSDMPRHQVSNFAKGLKEANGSPNG